MFLTDGTEVPVDELTIRQGLEGALRTLSLATPLLAAGLVAARLV